uniref:Uncharacterized protein n=1 Tax=Pseudomonas phage HRDY3 TaxID=3236930 RepID=A0AB39CE81_9VIRU
MKADTPVYTFDVKLTRAGFSIGNNPDATKNKMPEIFLDNVVYANLDFDAMGYEEKTRPYQLQLGVVERLQNIEYLYGIAYGTIELPKEIFLYTESNSKRVMATRKLNCLRLKNTSTGYSKMPGGEREFVLHRLTFQCFLYETEFPLGNK